MQSDKLFKALSTPYSALTSVIFGLMIVSFPIGAYVVFNSDIGKEIIFDFSIDGIDVFIAGIGIKIPIQFELGDGFIVVWCVYLVLFAVSLLGPKTNFSKALSSLISEGWHNIRNNYLLGMLTWFSILIVVSVIIDSVQQSFGIFVEPPETQNKLIQFFRITTSPLTEEIGFRMFLIGLPLFAMFATKISIGSFFKSLWHPSQNLEITNYKKALGLVIVVGIFFGVAHIISGSPWSTGKFAQASISGVIIGWVYVRHGLAPAILLHWATNYFIFSYIFFMSDINQTSNESSNPFLNTLEVLFFISGTLAIIIFILNYLKSKKEHATLV
ncbi:MAG TPA: CPBP family intramembrane glutamic endopeptidase [Nitrosopumilaceae archaeon]|nr:CPBP family intramembrane glutamic endopeptidase [Nitrosopumilaceae archaeon]